MHRSAAIIRFRSGFVFLLCFWKCGFYEFKCTVLVKLGRAIPDQVCSVHEILPLWSRTDQWTVKYNLLYGKINLDRILWRNGSMQFGCLIQNPVKDTLAALLCELFRIESTVYFSKKFACYDHEVISELSSTILCTWKSNWIEFFDIMLACSSVAWSKIQCKTLEQLCSASCLE